MRTLPMLGVLTLATLATAAAHGAPAKPKPPPPAAVTVSAQQEGNNPRIASDAKGVLHVTYQAAEPGKTPDIYTTSSSDGGKTWSVPIDVSNTPGISTDPAITVSESGEIAIVWADTSVGDASPDIFAVHSSDGMTWSKPVDLSNSPGVSSHPAIAIAADGSLHAVWRDTSEGDKSPDIFYARSSDHGATWTKLENVSKTPGSSSDPEIACSNSGSRVYVTWAEAGADDQNRDIFFTSSHDGGKLWAKPLNVSNTPGISSSPDLAVGARNDVFVTWEDAALGDTHPSILFNVSHNGGVSFEKAIDISKTTGFSSSPAMEANSKGEVAVVWTEKSKDGGPPDIWGTHSKDSGKTFAAARNLSNTPGASSLPDVTLTKGVAHAVWEEVESGKTQLKTVSSQ